MRSSVDQGTVQQGWVVHFETIPMAEIAPLVEGEWVDAYVVELTERGALLRKKGYVFKGADDNSPFAWERIGKATKDGFQAAGERTLWDHRDAAHTRLAAFPTASRALSSLLFRSAFSYKTEFRMAIPSGLPRLVSSSTSPG